MSELKIEYESGRFIEVDFSDYLLFVGGHNDWKRKLIRSLKRFSVSKSLNELEAGIYGENGIEIYFQDKQLKSRETNLLFLEDNLSIYNQLSFTKGNLMHEEMTELQHKNDITRQMETINNELINLESLINDYLIEFSDSITSSLNSLLFTDILKNNLNLSYSTKERDYPLEMMNSSELLDEYIKLLISLIERRGEDIWLVIVNPESFLDIQDVQYLFDELKKLAQKTKQLKFFVFSNQSLELNYTSEDISKTVLLYKDYEQMPEFDIFLQSIKRHYPDELCLSETEVISSFYRISHLIGRDSPDSYYLCPRDMILLKVINNLIDTNVAVETSRQHLTQLEEAFLKENY
ncbi:CRISPR-associated protein Csn2-St [Vagococcus fluvialis]|uniref:CRISPR-associated protein Csn2-St n=1 Tax=Vagococcus fluvialis TaxID=2738 RepID=UPI003B5B05F8